MSDGGAPSPQPLHCLDPGRHMNDPPDPSIVTNPHEQAWQSLINRTAPRDELPSLIETIFSGRKTTDMVDSLQQSDAQTFIDMIDEVHNYALYSEEGVDSHQIPPFTFCSLDVGDY